MRIFLIIFMVVAGFPSRITEFAPVTGKVDLVVVLKAERLMRLMSEGRVLRQYTVSLGANPVGHKMREGDERTPEGRYVLDWRNPKSIAHLSIHISYPDDKDKADAKARGEDPGGMIMIHGQMNFLGPFASIPASYDWTDGCIAVTNDEMDEIWNLVAPMTPIEIRP